MVNVVKLGSPYSRIRPFARDLVELHVENDTYTRTSDVPEIEMIIDLLRASPRLRVLVLVSLNIEFTFITWPRPVNLPRLRVLELRGFHNNVIKVLSLLRVPALETLCLGLCRFEPDPGPKATPPLHVANKTIKSIIWSFRTPENAPWWRAGGLKELSLEYGQCHLQEVTKLLRLTTNVETFHVSCPAILDILIDNPEILPNLRHLVVNTSIFCDPDLFSAILANRPGVTLLVRGDLTQVRRLYNSSKGTHDIALRG